jgi:hypothetical protein
MKNILVVLLVISILVAASYGGYKLNRWANYKFGYKSLVQKEFKPLEKKVADLETRIIALENNKK